MAYTSKNYNRYDKTLLDRIDKEADEKDFDPYGALKKETVDNNEMYGDNVYNNEETVNKSDGKAGTVLVIVLIACIIGAAVFAIVKIV